MKQLMISTLKHVEVMGIGILILVLLAISDTAITDHIYAWSLEYKVYLVMILFTILSLIFGILHSTDRLGFLRPIRSYFGTLLLVLGGGVFFFLPEYFHALANSNMDFWSRVSTYSLPAICVEGGLFTVFTEFLEHQRRTTQREYVLLSVAFLLYTAGAITTNFLALSDMLSVQHQIAFTRGIVLIVGTVGLSVRLLHPKSRNIN